MNCSGNGAYCWSTARKTQWGREPYAQCLQSTRLSRAMPLMEFSHSIAGLLMYMVACTNFQVPAAPVDRAGDEIRIRMQVLLCAALARVGLPCPQPGRAGRLLPVQRANYGNTKHGSRSAAAASRCADLFCHAWRTFARARFICKRTTCNLAASLASCVAALPLPQTKLALPARWPRDPAAAQRDPAGAGCHAAAAPGDVGQAGRDRESDGHGGKHEDPVVTGPTCMRLRAAAVQLILCPKGARCQAARSPLTH